MTTDQKIPSALAKGATVTLPSGARVPAATAVLVDLMVAGVEVTRVRKDFSDEYYDAMLEKAKEQLPPWAYKMLHDAAKAKAGGKARWRPKLEGAAVVTNVPFAKDQPGAGDVHVPTPLGSKKNKRPAVPPAIAKNAAIAFVAACPTALEVARGEPLVGPMGEVLRKQYLEPLGLERTNTVMLHAVPEILKSDDGSFREPTDDEVMDWRPWLLGTLQDANPRVVVALGKSARAALGALADFYLPHPNAVRKFGDSGEVPRKLRQIAKLLEIREAARKDLTDGAADEMVDAQGSAPPATIEKDGEADAALDTDAAGVHAPLLKSVQIAKSDGPNRITWGVVLDPYTEDSQSDWTPPAEVERAQRSHMLSQVVGLNHKGPDHGARVVESALFPYPTPDDYRAAMAGQPHRAFRLKFGGETIHSGAWTIGTQHTAAGWKRVEKGDLAAFSIGGDGVRTPATAADMPVVQFIDI